jgi:hypothetical protein
MKRSLLVVLIAVLLGAAFYTYRRRRFVPPPPCSCAAVTTNPLNDVNIRSVSPAPWQQCAVDKDPVCLSVAKKDEVRWCVDPQTSAHVWVKFDPSAPFEDANHQSITEIEIDPTANGGCSKPIHARGFGPSGGACAPYKYEVDYNKTQTCIDPTVILK